MNNEIITGDVRETLPQLPASSVHMCMTSPPYYGLRNYQEDEQIGLEESLDKYITELVGVGDALRRVLRDDGSWWLNLGDSYGDNKQKMLVPHRAAIALQEAGWVVRNDVSWVKPNPMPQSVKDRLNTTTEQIFHLTPQPDYWYDLDAIREPYSESMERRAHCQSKHGGHEDDGWGGGNHHEGGLLDDSKTYADTMHPAGKNPGDVFEVTTKPFPDAHFACVSDDTEILTKEGWKTHDELRRGEKVATYDTDADRVELESLSSVHTYDVDTELLHVGNRDLDILMTEDHRNVTQHSRTGEIRVRRGHDLTDRDKILVHAPAEWETNAGVGEPLAELVGWVIAEAHYRDSGGIRLYQQQGDDADRIRDLLDCLDVPHTERIRRETEVSWHIPVSPWADTIRSLAPEKQLTEFLASMPEDDLQALFDGLVRGDGYVRDDDGRVGFTEKNAVTRDWFQVIAFRLGYHAIDGTKDIHCTNRRAIGIRGTGGKGLNVDRVDYDGVVWCPKTPNGTWVARRNGRPFISGNTYPPELCDKPIKASCPPQVCVNCGAPYEREVERKTVYDHKTTEATGLDQDRNDTDGGDGHDVRNGVYSDAEFKGWSQTCDCDTDATESGIVLDPFAGAGTTLLKAKELGRRFVGIELNPEYADMARSRVGLDVDDPSRFRDDDAQQGFEAYQ